MFDDRSDASEKTMKVTVPSLPKENGVQVKISVIQLRSRQAKLFLAKIIVLDFTVECFSTRSCAQWNTITSEKAETSVTEIPENKDIWVERYSHKYSFVVKNSSLC